VPRINKLALWLAKDILRERGVAPGPDAMSAVLPVCYVVAQGVEMALREMAAELAVELAGGQAVIRIPVYAGTRPVEVEIDPADLADLAAWECELDDPADDGGL